MHHRPMVGLTAGAVLILAACSSGAATSAPTAEAPAAEASAPAAGGAPCAESAAAGEVSVAIEGFAFSPADIQARVGQTVTFSNGDPVPHTATLDDGSCTTPNLAKGASDGLIFNAAGIYPIHCNIHPSIKGTITVS